MTDEEMAGVLGGGGPKAMTDDQMAEHLAAINPAPQGPISVPQSKREHGWLERLGEGIGTIGAGAAAIGDAATHPIDTLTSGTRRRQLERGVDDMVTLGLGQRLAGWAGNKLGDTGDNSLRDTADVDQRIAPEYRTAGNLIGMVGPGVVRATAGRLPGVAGKLGRAATGGASEWIGKQGAGFASQVMPKAASALGGAGAGLAGGLLGYEASAVPLAGAQAAVGGESPWNAMYQAATDPMGLMTAGAAGAMGGSARGYAEHARDPSTLSGRTLQDVEAAGGKVGLRGARGGAFEHPEMTSLKEGRAGINELGSQSAERVIADNARRLEEARNAYGEAQDQILSAHGDRHLPTLSTHKALDAIEAQNTINGVVADEALAAKAAKLRRMLTTETGQLDMRATQAAGGRPIYVSAPAVKAKDLIGARRAVNGWIAGATGSERHALGQMLEGLADDAAAADPRIGEMNAKYRQEMQSLSAINDSLFGQNRPELNNTEAARAQGAARFGRLGDETQAGTLGEPRMQRAAKESPQVEREMLLNRAKKAQERLRFGASGVSMPLEQGVAYEGRREGRRMGGAILGHALGGFAGGIAGERLGNALANPVAFKLRMGLPLADIAGRVQGAPTALGADRLVQLARERDEADKEAAARLSGAQP